MTVHLGPHRPALKGAARPIRVAVLAPDRPFRLVPEAAWNHRSMPFDAQFGGDFHFYFRTREDMTRFNSRYKSSDAMQQKDGT